MIPYPEVTSLFKYMPWLGFARETLLEQKIWYSSMSAFNDPFEGIYDIQNDLSVHAAIALAAKYKRIVIGMSRRVHPRPGSPSPA